ncbi:MAG: glycoside hydrolase family 15 protein [Betaproteobacteria bacterium]
MNRGRTVYYGIVGNGETVALIGPDATVAWFCLPRFDGIPVLAAALDPGQGGSLRLDFGRPLSLQAQEYAGRTNVLVTRLASPELSVEVCDFMPWGKRCLVRDVTARNTGAAPQSVTCALQLRPVRSALFPLATQSLPGAEWAGRQAAAVSGTGWALICGLLSREPGAGDCPPFPRLVAPGAQFTWRVVLAYGATLESAAQEFARAGGEELDQTLAFWTDWLSQARPVNLEETALVKPYYRSLLTLKLLCHDASGAILAAPTASFPAGPGGGDNWDYRYCWLRDGCDAAEALDAAGFHVEARRFYRFILDLQAEDGSWPQPLYTIDGTYPHELEAPDLAGPGGERPVRFGNQAAGQLQLDNAGHVVHGLWRHFELTGDEAFLAEVWPRVESAVRWVAANWRRAESGIWEIREELVHWLHGKALCYAALTAGAQIALALGRAEPARAWLAEASGLREEVIREGWSDPRQAFLRDYRDEAPLDISVLALEFYGLVEPGDPKLAATVRRMERPSSEGGLLFCGGVLRFEGGALPFYLATFWLARHYLHTGRRQEALALVDLCLCSSTTLDLMAEHFDPRTGAQWGNFPQAFSHEELIQFCQELAANFKHPRDPGHSGSSTS